ncbi:hypothetical protein [Flavobacterium sp. HJSW_4]|uniref:hypothetical protein n=1 Tax=Flavobacterium sp. HJSW_4 TaxID=3344660 RepID=UPI0035F2FB8F
MKRGITLIILMLLVFQNAGSIWIIGDFYINRDYIAKNICVNRFDAVPMCNGKCYLVNKLKANDKQEQKFPSVNYKEVQLFLEVPFTISFPTIRSEFKMEYPFLKEANQKSSFIFSIYHPPKCG